MLFHLSVKINSSQHSAQLQSANSSSFCLCVCVCSHARELTCLDDGEAYVYSSRYLNCYFK